MDSDADAALALALQLEEEEAVRQEQQQAAAHTRVDEVAQNLSYGLTLAAKVKEQGRGEDRCSSGSFLALFFFPLSRALTSSSSSSSHPRTKKTTTAPVPGFPGSGEGRHTDRQDPQGVEAGGPRRGRKGEGK